MCVKLDFPYAKMHPAFIFLIANEGSITANYEALTKCKKFWEIMRKTMHTLQKFITNPLRHAAMLMIVTHCHLQNNQLIQ